MAIARASTTPLPMRRRWRRCWTGAGQTYTSRSGLAAVLKVEQVGDEVRCDARGRLLTSRKKSVTGGDVRYALQYVIDADRVEIVARADADHSPEGLLKFILPVISRSEEQVQADGHTLRIVKPKWTLLLRGSCGTFTAVPAEPILNLVLG